MSDTYVDWKSLALWLLDCEVATTEHLQSLKSSSKFEVRRHLSICVGSLQYLDGIPDRRPRPVEEVRKRLESCLDC